MKLDILYLPSFLFGITSFFHCIAMCGPFVGVLNMMSDSKWRTNLCYNFGRLVSYSLLGALFGFLGLGANSTGSLVRIQNLSVIFSAFILVLFGLSFFFQKEFLSFNLMQVFLQKKLHPFLARMKKSNRAFSFSFILGLISGLLPCGMLYPAFVLSFATGDPLSGSFSMLAFFMGTFPGLFLFGIGLKKLNSYLILGKARMIGYAIVLSAFLIVYMRYLPFDKNVDNTPSCHSPKQEDNLSNRVHNH
ncbi:MAG: sulfite exporter TauE/SafE family protein [Leptospiraceae bacterium]|nr:sulfite exporter TauE/SafE family protein [Leptospiraceae bacterium]